MTQRLYVELGDLQKLYEYSPALFNSWERGFLEDSLLRFKEYGSKAFFTSKQENKLSVILEKVRANVNKGF